MKTRRRRRKRRAGVEGEGEWPKKEDEGMCMDK
jgi:hypothetical protein